MSSHRHWRLISEGDRASKAAFDRLREVFHGLMVKFSQLMKADFWLVCFACLASVTPNGSVLDNIRTAWCEYRNNVPENIYLSLMLRVDFNQQQEYKYSMGICWCFHWPKKKTPIKEDYINECLKGECLCQQHFLAILLLKTLGWPTS